MVVDVQVLGEEKSPRQLEPKTGQDWTGLEGRASQPGKVSVSSVYGQLAPDLVRGS